jgi:hypothetical protein
MKTLSVLLIPLLLSVSAIAGVKYYANTSFINDEIYLQHCVTAPNISSESVNACRQPFIANPIFFNGKYCGITRYDAVTRLDEEVVRSMPSLCSISQEQMLVAFKKLYDNGLLAQTTFDEWLVRKIVIHEEEQKTVLDMRAIDSYFM